MSWSEVAAGATARGGTGRPVQALVLPELADQAGRRSDTAERRATLRAGEILQAAEVQAQGLLEAARSKAARLIGEAYRDGRQQGQVEACAEYRERLQAVLGELAAATGRIRALEREVRDGGAELIVGLVGKLAERILGRAAAAEPALLLPVVRAALRALGEPAEARVRLHPELCGPVADLLAHEAAEGGLTLVPDETIGPAGCVVETATAFADARLSVQLEEARRRLLEAAW